uniref:NADH dehydrogenase subunit 2 n=1 Tax=Enoplolambrus validus TaxID=2969665 RepID=UPI0023F58018|nr:NADH dehydrogenase subunit 2 [Enoplolambrus validus]WDV10161.1 NADH dehydrogenase subunit 2 [Enoplolambrus validus]
MLFPFSSVLFFSSLLLGIFLSISSSSWFSAWIGLELNLLSFIPLIFSKMNPYLSEVALKYFLIQAMASTMIIFSSSLFMMNLLFSSCIMIFSLLLKLGAAPFHFWFPQVMEGLTWPQATVLMTLQKLAPMFLISLLTANSTLITILMTSSIFSALIGALSGFNMMKLRKIMAFSSINHMSWMLISISMNDMMWTVYFLFYSAISISVVFLFYSYQMYHINQIFSSISLNNQILSLIIPLSLLSLGGLPPLTGFLPKWMMIQMLITNKMYFTLFFLLFSALITLYFYLRIFLPFTLFSNPTPSLSIKIHSLSPSLSSHTLIISFFNSVGLFFSFPFLFL